MPPALDTPARAARSSRPRTRAWRRLISEADRDCESAVKIRAELRRHLDAAERLASRRARRTNAPDAPLDSDSDAADTTHSTLEERPAPVSDELHPLHVLHSLDTNWNERVDALRQFQASPTDLALLAPWLALQLTDLRSRIVVEAAAAVAAAESIYTPEHARIIFDAAISGIAVSKKVMAEARERAAFSAVSAQTDNALWAYIASCAETASQEQGRKLCVDALSRYATHSSCENRADVVRQALSVAAVDKSQSVRNAARELADAFRKQAGNDDANAMLEGLPAEARSRLEPKVSPSMARSSTTAKAGEGLAERLQTMPGANKARPAGKPSMKEMIRQRREAMKKQKLAAAAAEKAGSGAGDVTMTVDNAKAVEQEATQGMTAMDVHHDEDGPDASKKRHSADIRLSGRKDSLKKRALISTEKENFPQSSV